MKLKKVISGGQTGIDQAGLEAAKLEGFETGGLMPKGFKTLSGKKPQFKQLYNMSEDSSETYPPRTYANVHNSDATIRIARNFNSLGEALTLKAISYYNKRSKDIDLDNPGDPKDLAKWLIDLEVEILNIAGNSESTAPGAFKKGLNYLVQVFKEYKDLCK